MDVRIWGVVDDRLIEICATWDSNSDGVRIEGLPEDRCRTTADRIRAALLNSGVLTEVPPVAIRVEPSLSAGRTSDLDLPVALGVLVAANSLRLRLRWIVSTARLGLDGAVYAEGVTEPLSLTDVVRGLSCQTPLVKSAHMFEEVATRDE